MPPLAALLEAAAPLLFELLLEPLFEPLLEAAAPPLFEPLLALLVVAALPLPLVPPAPPAPADELDPERVSLPHPETNAATARQTNPRVRMSRDYAAALTIPSGS